MVARRSPKSEKLSHVNAPFCPTSPASNQNQHQDQVRYLILSLLAGATLLIARLLQPSPRGVGTHKQLGLPSCPFLHFTGIPCPSCGLTTSFAHAARLHFVSSFITQPFGFIAFCLTALYLPVSIYLIWRRVAWSALIHSRHSDTLMYALIVLYLLSWIYKIIAIKWLFIGG